MKLLSEELADYIVSLEYDALPPAVQEMAVDCFLDWLGSALRGALEPSAKAVAGLTVGRPPWCSA